MLAGVLLVAGCETSPALPPVPRSETKIEPIAKEYRTYGLVDDLRRWAPELCEAPRQPAPRFSQSRDAETHGRKLYHLYAKDRGAYLHAREVPQPVGQVIVKESWVPKEVSEKEAGNLRAVFKGGKYYHASKQAALFLMIKGEAGPDTDEGWTYATVTPDGTTVTASGRLASCMECHVNAKVDRMFGLGYCASPQ